MNEDQDTQENDIIADQLSEQDTGPWEDAVVEDVNGEKYIRTFE